MKNKVMEILQDVRADVDFEKETKLIDDKILESFDIISLVAELNDEFEIEIGPKELTAENFNSVNSIISMIEGLKNE
ncbi:phosphopantetheine-binding protein [uncultured Treponema sp.]|uniref:phosphopantetheine-binding protein n=1 Tax=uncultured Treponema sp. TaxID=162155 RepID=UPI0025906D23|nr:phosphopantetheine-binding protein [uncultured Treponema sp.]